MIQIVHPGPAQPPVVPDEAAGLDHVDADAHAGGKAQDAAGVLGDFGLVESKAHAAYLGRAAPVQQWHGDAHPQPRPHRTSKKDAGPSRIRTAVVGFKVPSDNHYTNGPTSGCAASLFLMYTWSPV